ncbi:hypothetical protein VKT23_013409 [Stygiomarasmius scandens]|uniref:Uncharacterized protein n=1 Tax=Marasmiellus scandens TaxID=2682957 RepID=A0ABR1J800_9AGAR
MYLEGYQRRYGPGVASVYSQGKTQADMINDINNELQREIAAKLPTPQSLSEVSGLIIDLGDTPYGLGTLGRRYVNQVHRVGLGPRDFITGRTYCTGPSMIEAFGLSVISSGVIGELLRIRHALQNYGEKLDITRQEIGFGPPGTYPYPDRRKKRSRCDVNTLGTITQPTDTSEQSATGGRHNLSPKRKASLTITAKFFMQVCVHIGPQQLSALNDSVQDHTDPIEAALPLQHGRFKLAAHKILLGEVGVERSGRWQLWKTVRRGGEWKDITWEVSVRGKKGDLFFFKRKEVDFPKNLDMHVEHI